jgi:hypothetical protein
MTDALMERVDDLIGARTERPREPLTQRVANLFEADTQPLLATTPTSLAIREVAARIGVLEAALREVVLEIQEFAAHER